MDSADIDPRKTKVLHMSMNPTGIARATIVEQLHQRITDLEAQLVCLQESARLAPPVEQRDASVVASSASSLDILSKLQAENQFLKTEEARLREMIARYEASPDSEKKYQRFKELYSSMFAQYKEVRCLIFISRFDRAFSFVSGSLHSARCQGVCSFFLYFFLINLLISISSSIESVSNRFIV